MAKAPSPMLMTVVLSAAAVLGYLTYRLAMTDGAPSAPPEVAEEREAPRELADSLPQFSLDNLAGEPVPITSWPDKPLLVNFWATWCAPCLREIPLLKSFQTEHPDLQVVGIAVDRRDPVESFAAEMQFNYPVLVGQTDAMDAAGLLGVEVYALPVTVFAAKDGHVLGIHTGEIHDEHLENFAAVLEDLESQRIDVAAARARMAGSM